MAHERVGAPDVADACLWTPRLVLRPLDSQAAHGALYRALYTCPQVMAHVMPPLSEVAADAAYRSACRHNTRHRPGHRFWVIEARDTGTAIGLTALQRDGAQAELGILLKPDWQRRGVASEAFEVLLGHAFGAMGLALVHAQRVDDGQARIIDRLLGRFGFVRAGPGIAPPGHCRWLLPLGAHAPGAV